MDFSTSNAGAAGQFRSADIDHLEPAEGWFELGNYTEAKKELDLIDPRQAQQLEVLVLRLRTCFNLKQWEETLAVATAVLQQDHTYSDYWIKRSYALHELNRTREAYDLLKPSVGLFPGEEVIPFNLNCYARALGRPLTAFYWRNMALRRNWRGVFNSIDRTQKDNPKWQAHKARWERRMKWVESLFGRELQAAPTAAPRPRPPR